ncbi:hydroxysteroid 11-beta-dehydrogenase 1-like protein A isoform 2-T3 [Anomaloglossus baeobatrachus]
MAGLKLLLWSLIVGLSAYYFYSTDTITPEMVKGKRVIVTGSSTGIGEQIAYRFSEMGAHVMLTARRAKQLQEVAKKCLELGAGSARYVVADMENMTSAQNVAQEAIKQLGRIGSPFSATYCAAKFALEGFFSSLRREFIMKKNNVSVTVAILGFIDTENAVKKIGDKVTMSASPKEECAIEIVNAAVLRQPEVFYPYWGIKPLWLLHNLAPNLIRNLLDKMYVQENIS